MSQFRVAFYIKSTFSNEGSLFLPSMISGRKHDIFRFLGKLSFKKLINAAKILVSYYFSKALGKAILWGQPVSLSIEPTTACNLRCPECPSGLRAFTRPTGNLKQEPYRELIDEISDDAMFLILYFQGEPYINPDFLKMVEYAAHKKLYTITSTNGHFLSERNAELTVRSGLDRIIISIDGIKQQTYEAYRREGSLDEVLEGTKRLIKWKKKLNSHHPYIVFQFLVVAPNEHEIPHLQQLADELGVNEVKLKSAQLYDYEHGHPLIPSNQKYSRYVKMTDGRYRLKYKISNQCWKMWHSAVVTWDGQVVPCCFDKDAQHVMGNVKKNRFKDLWHTPQYNQFRQRILNDRKGINICNNCTEGCKVWV